MEDASARLFTSKEALFRILGRPGKRFHFFLFSSSPFSCSFIYARASIFEYETSMKALPRQAFFLWGDVKKVLILIDA